LQDLRSSHPKPVRNVVELPPTALSPFQAPWWLGSTHLQTILAKYLAPKRQVVTRQSMLQLPDGDELQLNWGLSHQPSPTTPLVILLHGLEGNLRSHYIQGMIKSLEQHGYATVLMHFRGCHGKANKLPRAYHSGDTADFGYFLTTLRQQWPDVPLAAIGFSLGGNVVVKYCGEQGTANPLFASVAVSAPLDLSASADRINQGFSKVYQRYLLDRLKATMQRKLAAHADFPLAVNQADIQQLQNIRQFDEMITAPMHDFLHAEDYYQRCSGKAFLSQVAKPLLLVHAADDPFLGASSIPSPSELNPFVQLMLSQKGGHVGFVAGTVPWRRYYWLEQLVPQFLQQLRPTITTDPNHSQHEQS
jgi:predicted alpha/beta-fold hydrolase